MAKKTYTYKEIEKMRIADNNFRTSVTNVARIVRFLFYFAGLPLILTETVITMNLPKVFDITEITSADLAYLLGADLEGPIRYLMFDYAIKQIDFGDMLTCMIRWFLAQGVIPWLAGVVAALIAAPVFRSGKVKFSFDIDFLPITILSSVAAVALYMIRLAGTQQRSFMAGFRLLFDEVWWAGLLALLPLTALYALPTAVVLWFLRICDVFTPYSTERSAKLPKEELKGYLDRVYGRTPAGVKRLADSIITDRRFGTRREQYTAVCYCIEAINHGEECRRLSDDDRWGLYYALSREVDIIRQHEEGSIKRDLDECYRRLERWMDQIHPVHVFVEDVVARMRGSASGGSPSYDRRLHDELDAAQKASRISRKYGDDWKGYDPEARGRDPEAPGPDPESFRNDIW